MNEVNDVNAALLAGAALAEPRMPHGQGVQYIVVPDGYEMKTLESQMLNPVRKRATVTLLDADSFIVYSKKHGSMDHCTIYADMNYESSKCRLVAVIDDHGSLPEQAQWRDHKATYEPKLSVEWKRWYGGDKKPMAQAEFAAFIEENLGDIASVDGMPTGTQMLAMALAFDATSEKRFKKKIDLQSGGVALEYIDQADETTSTKMQFFERFTIGIPVFQGSASAYPVEARLKFRQSNDKLAFWYELIRVDRVFRQAADDAVAKISEATGFMMLIGNPGT